MVVVVEMEVATGAQEDSAVALAVLLPMALLIKEISEFKQF